MKMRINQLFLMVIITVATGSSAFDTRSLDIPNSEMDRGMHRLCSIVLNDLHFRWSKI